MNRQADLTDLLTASSGKGLQEDTLSRVVEYYSKTVLEYDLVLATNEHYGIHYGYYREGTDDHRQAILEMNQVLADCAGVVPGNRVLDAGCGVAGSSIWLARNKGASVLGITASSEQCARAREIIDHHELSGSVRVEVLDFRKTGLPSGSFDVVWGLESVCYADVKLDFVREARRLLKPGGVLVVADGFRSRDTYSPEDESELRAWLDGWAVPDLDSASTFASALAGQDFSQIEVEDISDRVMPFSRWLWKRAMVLVPIARVLVALGLFSPVQLENGRSALRQYPLLRRGLWKYLIFRAIASNVWFASTLLALDVVLDCWIISSYGWLCSGVSAPCSIHLKTK